jgi:hypothetical protein
MYNQTQNLRILSTRRILLSVNTEQAESHCAYTKYEQSLIPHLHNTRRVLLSVYSVKSRPSPLYCEMTVQYTVLSNLLKNGLSMMHPVYCVSHGGTPYPVSRISSTFYGISWLVYIIYLLHCIRFHTFIQHLLRYLLARIPHIPSPLYPVSYISCKETAKMLAL